MTMNDESDIPLLTDLIERADEIELSDLGLGQEFALGDSASDAREIPAETKITPALEQEIRRILDEHMELAWQEIRLVIQQANTDTNPES